MNSDLHRLLDRLSERRDVPNSDKIIPCIDESRDLAIHNEEGIAFENMCQNLFEWDFPLTKEDYAIIEELGRYYRFDESTWSFLAEVVTC
jgi:hypothetical protein